MANNGVYQKFLKNLPVLTRRLNSAPTSFSAVDLTATTTTTATKPVTTSTAAATAFVDDHERKNILNFEDGEALFSSVSSLKLMRSAMTLHMAAIEPLVDVGLWVLNSRLMEVSLFRKVVLESVKHTFYDHFCAGENLEEVGRTCAKLQDAGLKGMLDYGLEHAIDNVSCDQNLVQFLQTIDSTKSLPPSSVSFIVVKITAICPLSLLRRVSDLLRWEYKDNSINLPWKLESLPILSDSSALYHTLKKPEPLTPEEESDLQLAHERLKKICERCVETNVPVLIDAEDTSIQPAIDYFTYSAAIKYHKDDDPVVFGTIQAYLKDAKERMVLAKRAAEKMGVPMGFKLVRGAYMSSETQFAASLGVNSPIHDGIERTHACYNDCAAFMLEQIANGSGALVLATHNVESGKIAANKALDLGIDRGNEKLQFAQLYGMAESLSGGLRNAGFQVSKYLPFGPVEQIMPYIIRRAEENRGLLSSASLDRQLMRKELIRRLKSGVGSGKSISVTCT